MLGLGTFLLAFALSYVGTVTLLRLRPLRGFVDVPNVRSSHEAPKPRFGGIALVGAFTLAFVLVMVKRADVSYLPLVIGGLIVFATGVIDDRRSLPIWVRFGAQGAAAAIVVVSGHIVSAVSLPLVGVVELGPLGIPFTVLFILASINFYNFIDGIDGLAAGSGMIAALFLAFIASMLGHTTLAMLLLALAGAAAGFLQFNFPPSRLFMGDSGSTFLGFTFAYVAVAGNRLEPAIPFFVPVLLLSSLYLDAGLTLVRRALKGEKIFQAHKIHYYQRLLSLGLNHKQVTVIEYALTVLLGISAVIYFKAGDFFPAFLMICWAAIFSIAILKIRSLERGDRMFWERRSMLVIVGDLLMIAVAYFGAYFVRMGFRFTDPEGLAVLRAFPIVFVVRSACFYWFGLYRGVWKYTSTPDVLRIVKAVATGSAIILTLVVLFYRFVSFPRSLFVIEFVLLILMLGGSRFASRLFHEFGKDALGSNPRRIAIVGAGDQGEHIGREIRNTEGKTASIVCYVDDNKDKIGLVLRGVPIVGPIDELTDICRRFDIDAMVIGIANLPEERLRAILSKARDAGVEVDSRDAVGTRRASLVDLDRVARSTGRDNVTAGEAARRFFDGRRVLITHGGHTVGPALAAELVACGAVVSVQTGSQRDTTRFRGVDVRLFASSFEREFDVARILEATRPDVIFHCCGIGAEGIANADDYLWRSLIRSTDALAKVSARLPVESLAVVTFYDGDITDTTATRYAALGEVLALNTPSLVPLAPKVLRLPRILTRGELSRVAQGQLENQRFDLLEPEAVALCVEAAAEYKGRAILVPKTGTSLTTEQVAAVMRSKPAPVTAVPRGDLIFAGEEPKPSIITGAREIVGPMHPASEELIALAAECAGAVSQDAAAAVGERFSTTVLGRGRVTGTSVD
jgi:UDP-GlcNAc:undecaprenyl-phosphate GlcNAc-1-phosphate transferase